jgi:hypothetical protein
MSKDNSIIKFLKFKASHAAKKQKNLRLFLDYGMAFQKHISLKSYLSFISNEIFQISNYEYLFN